MIFFLFDYIGWFIFVEMRNIVFMRCIFGSKKHIVAMIFGDYMIDDLIFGGQYLV